MSKNIPFFKRYTAKEELILRKSKLEDLAEDIAEEWNEDQTTETIENLVHDVFFQGRKTEPEYLGMTREIDEEL